MRPLARLLERYSTDPFTWVLRVLAVAILAFMLVASLHNVSQAFDIWYYHMPFATRIAGIVGPDSFLFHPANEERFKGFPQVAEYIQGALWKVTGVPETANLLSFATIPAFAWFLRRFFAVPLYASVLCLVAVPLVHIHATTPQPDFPASAAGAALILLAIRSYLEPKPPDPKTLAVAAFVTWFGINTKSTVHPIILAAFVPLALRAIVKSGAPPEPERARYRKLLFGLVLLTPIMFFNPLKNLILYDNPYYPHQLKLLGHKFPGAEVEYSFVPTWLKHVPKPLQFAASIFELRSRPLSSPMRWSVAQFAPYNQPMSRMGGFFGAYVFALLSALLLRLVKNRTRTVVGVTAGFGIVTLITSIMPQCFELRYHMYWMLTLISANLWLACSPDVYLAKLVDPRALGAVATLALCAVLYSTRGMYVLPTDFTFKQFVNANVKRGDLKQIDEGETVCIRREPHNLLFAAPFHPGRHYVLQALEKGDTCEGHREVTINRRRRTTRERRGKGRRRSPKRGNVP